MSKSTAIKMILGSLAAALAAASQFLPAPYASIASHVAALLAGIAAYQIVPSAPKPEAGA